MGMMGPFFRVLPTPARVATNAAILATYHMPWTVMVHDGDQPVATKTAHYPTFTPSFGDNTPMMVIAPAKQWPAGRSLRVVAKLDGNPHEIEHPFATGTRPHDEPPRCEWSGPLSIFRQVGPSGPMDGWPTNMPVPPRNLRQFPFPIVYSTAGYMVSARVRVTDLGNAWFDTGAIAATHPSTPPPSPGQPSSSIGLQPQYRTEFSNDAQIIGIELTDLAGNVARYGEITG